MLDTALRDVRHWSPNDNPLSDLIVAKEKGGFGISHAITLLNACDDVCTATVAGRFVSTPSRRKEPYYAPKQYASAQRGRYLSSPSVSRGDSIGLGALQVAVNRKRFLSLLNSCAIARDGHACNDHGS